VAESVDRRGMAAAQTEVTDGSESDLVDAPGRARDHPVMDIVPNEALSLSLSLSLSLCVHAEHLHVILTEYAFIDWTSHSSNTSPYPPHAHSPVLPVPRTERARTHTHSAPDGTPARRH